MRSTSSTMTKTKPLDALSISTVTSCPEGHFTSPTFLGSMLAIGLRLACGVGGFGLAAPILAPIDQDIGPDPNVVWVALVYTLITAVGMTIVGRLTVRPLHLTASDEAWLMINRIYLVGGELPPLFKHDNLFSHVFQVVLRRRRCAGLDWLYRGEHCNSSMTESVIVYMLTPLHRPRTFPRSSVVRFSSASLASARCNSPSPWENWCR